MSSLSNINNNSAVINVGRTTPVNPGPQPAAASIPVVLASDQTPVPVVEQNKIQSEVALSLLGIPRSEVALGIFADVNTYDVNPVEWSFSPTEYVNGYGIRHLPEEAGALVEAPKDQTAVLTSKRFFRYQPGRVSAATFGVKTTLSPTEKLEEGEFNLNPAIRKYGIFDKYDGYYWEIRADGLDDRFVVVRRTQSLLKYNPVPFNSTDGQQQDYGLAGRGAIVADVNQEPTATKLLINNRFTLAENAFAAAAAVGGAIGTYLNGLSPENRAKCLRDMDFAIDAYVLDLQYGSTAHSIINATTYATAILNNAAGEQEVHSQLKTAIKTLLTSNGETTAASKIDTLAAFTISAVGGVQPTTTQINNASYGSRSKISAVFSIYNRYFAYLVSESMTYTDANPDIDTTEIKNRCLRDTVYVIDGYVRDLEFGGNAGTVFNAKNYYYNGIRVFSQTVDGVVAEVARHTFLKQLISSSSNVTVTKSNGATVNIPSAFTRFGLTSYKTKFDGLANLIINNFTTEYTGPAEFGSAPQFGHLVIYRDNLLMVHAAVYDPSLLKAKKQVVVRVDVTNNTLEAAEDSFVIGQHINFKGNAGGLTSEKLYVVVNVSGPKGNIIKLADPADETKAVIDITSVGTGTQYIEPNVPFIFPSEYFVGNTPEDPLGNFIRPDGMFPYMYTSDGVLPAAATSKTVGFIDTAIRTNVNAATLKQQIDLVNLRWNNWIKENVDPKYYSVYEYRIPRSRFSTDQLNGETNKVVYSDISTGTSGKTYAGEPVLDNRGIQLENTSAWNMDFSKVTMLKIEFSWYGAVGALFLAYVPVGNGEARWVRVHHLRASNQLKIPSMGNATLPITYLVYGGGSVPKLGAEDTKDKGYGSVADHIVKYGASYYIDGGDRGTVRLYSHSNDNPVDVYGSRFNIGNLVEGDTYKTDAVGTYIDITPRQINQIAFAKAVSFTDPTSGSTDSRKAIKRRLLDNRDFITSEINAWVNVNYPNNDHNPYKCTRDVLYVCNAFIYDMLYGGNTATYDASKFFFYDGFDKTTAVHKEQTIAAYGRLKEIVSYVVLGNVSWSKSTGNNETQVTTGDNALPADASTLQGLVQVVINAITDKSLPATKTAPSTSWAISSYTTAKAAIEASRTAIINAVVPNASDTKCRRDIGYIVDGVTYDITLGTNYNATFLALAEANSAEYPLNANVVSAINASQTQIKALPGVDSTAALEVDKFYSKVATIAINPETRVYDNLLPASGTFFMNAKVVTSSRQDQNVEVIWTSGYKLYLNKTVLNSTNNVYLVSARSSTIFGLKSKENIANQKGTNIRNRVQVYPTKLSTSNLSNSPIKMKVVKTPYFQPVNTTTGSFTLTSSYEVTSANLALPTSSTTYLAKDDDYVYGWFRANVGTVFGKLYRDDGVYHFSLLQTFGVPVVLLSGVAFLKEERFDLEGNLLTTVSEEAITKERLSSVFVSTEIQLPIPKTGTEIASFFLRPGSDQFDLATYFDYNKDYLSYPLTNQVESLYLTCDSSNSSGLLGGVSASLAWEEQ